MDPLSEILDPKYDRLVIEDPNTRLSLAIDTFKETESNQYSKSIAQALSIITNVTVSSDLLNSLRDGTILCQVFEQCAPQVNLGRWHKQTNGIVAFESENIFIFSQGCKELGMHQSSLISYSVFKNRDIYQLVTCLIHLFKILYPNITKKDKKIESIVVATGTLTKEDRQLIQFTVDNSFIIDKELLDKVLHESKDNLNIGELIEEEYYADQATSALKDSTMHDQSKLSNEFPVCSDVTCHYDDENGENSETGETGETGENAVNGENDVNAINTVNTVNTVNTINTIDAINTMSATEAIHALDATTATNAIDAIDAIDAINTIISDEEKECWAEINRLQEEDELRLQKEKEERMERIDQIRRENGLLSSDEENAWEEEEEEENRRRTIFFHSMRQEMSKMLMEVKLGKTKMKVHEVSKTIQKRLNDDKQERKKAQIKRDTLQKEKRQQLTHALSYTERKERERKETLRRQQREYAQQMKKEEEEKARKAREQRKRCEEERKRRMEEMNKRKQEEKQRNAEKKRQWLEEKKRYEEEEKRKAEIALQKRRAMYARVQRETAEKQTQRHGVGSPHSCRSVNSAGSPSRPNPHKSYK